jgi:hypothetical protein
MALSRGCVARMQSRRLKPSRMAELEDYLFMMAILFMTYKLMDIKIAEHEYRKHKDK